MTTPVHTLMARFSGEAVMACPSKAEAFSANLQTAMAHPDFAKVSGKTEVMSADDDFWPDEDDYMSNFRPYKVADGVLTIPVVGSLVKGFPYTFYGMITGYEYIQRAYDRGMDDPNVKGIVLQINSPGGEVAGNFALVDKMFARREEKPVVAVADEHAYSAAYSIASVASTIYIARTGGVGSIGVVTSHLNMAKMLDRVGYEITFIYAGDHKVDGNPYGPLSPEVKARIQARIDYLYNVFVSTVSRNRNISEQAVRDTQALTFGADEAIGKGLADKVGSLEDATNDFATRVFPQGVSMSQSAPQEATAQAAQANLDAARAAGSAEGANLERERIKAIQTSPEAEGRSTMANHIAFNTGMSTVEAISLLAAAPKEAATVAPTEKVEASAFEKAMAEGNPNVGASTDSKGGPGEVDACSANSILNDFRAAGGATVSTK